MPCGSPSTKSLSLNLLSLRTVSRANYVEIKSDSDSFATAGDESDRADTFHMYDRTF